MADTGLSRDQIKLIGAGIIGNILEWYDFAVYGFFAHILAKQFFPSDDPTVSLIASYGAFAAGFLMRPIGGWLFGWIGDSIGRKRALMLSIGLMAVPSFLIGVLPTYADWGVAAAVLLVLLRMMQGVAVGGEYTSSIVFLAEHAPGTRRAFFTCWALFGATGGILLGSTVGAAISAMVSDAALEAWGWRIPFISGVVVALVGYAIRRGIAETSPEPKDDGKAPVVEAVRHHWRSMAHILALNVGFAVTFYTAFVYMVGWLVSNVHEARSEALSINSLAMVLLAVIVPFAAMASDRLGRRPGLIIGAALMVVLPYPLVSLMHHQNEAMVLIGQLSFAAIIAIFVGGLPATLCEAFPPHIRVTAVSISYNLCFAVFGGTSPMVATWILSRSGSDISFAWYLSAMAAVSLVAAILLKETAHKPLDATDGQEPV